MCLKLKPLTMSRHYKKQTNFHLNLRHNQHYCYLSCIAYEININTKTLQVLMPIFSPILVKLYIHTYIRNIHTYTNIHTNIQHEDEILI